MRSQRLGGLPVLLALAVYLLAEALDFGHKRISLPRIPTAIQASFTGH